MSLSIVSSAMGRNSSNSWNWRQSSQSEVYFKEIKYVIFASCLQNKENWRCFTGLPLGIGYGVLTAASQICLIAEQLFKGLGNMFGSIHPDSDLSFMVGWQQLSLASRNVFYLLIIAPFIPIFSLFVIPILTFFSPDSTKELFMNTSCTLNTGVDETDTNDFQNTFNDAEIVF